MLHRVKVRKTQDYLALVRENHWEVTKAFKKSTHVDVGESFDRIGFVNLVSHYLGVI